MLYCLLLLFSSLTALEAKNQNLILTVLEFSAEGNQNDGNGTYSHASFVIADIPSSFTACVSFQVESWTSGLTSAFLFVIQMEAGLNWMEVKISAESKYTEFGVSVGDSSFATETLKLFSPMQWTRVCISLEGTKANLVADETYLVATNVGCNQSLQHPS